jgi:hypothetical protein
MTASRTWRSSTPATGPPASTRGPPPSSCSQDPRRTGGGRSTSGSPRRSP